MANYTQTTDFSVKDSLASGDSSKIIRGSEFDTEFTNVAAAISSKADLASPTFTGTPAAPTAGSGTNTTQLATTAFVQTAIGSISSGVTSVAAGTDINVTGTGSGPYTGAVTVAAGANLATLAGTQTFSGAKTFNASVTFGSTGLANNTFIVNPSNQTNKTFIVGDSSSPSENWNFYSKAQVGHNAGIFDGSGSNTAGIEILNTSTSGTSFIWFSYSTFSNQIGVINTTNGTSVNYNTTSDYRLKTNVTPIDNSIARVKQLNPVRFSWTSLPNSNLEDGFLAHEVQEVIPAAVSGEKDAVREDGSIKPQGMDYSKLVPLLTAALQEAITRIETLESKVAALEAA